MKTLFINQVDLTRTKCVLKIFLQGTSPGHYHKLTFPSFEACIAAQNKLSSKRRSVIKDCLTKYTWLIDGNKKEFINSSYSNSIYLGKA